MPAGAEGSVCGRESDAPGTGSVAAADRGGRLGRWWPAIAVALAVTVATTRMLFPPATQSDLTIEVNFISEPLRATIYVDGTRLSTPAGIPYKTPCTVPNLPSRIGHVVFKHSDLDDLDAGPVDFSVVREVEARWHAEVPDAGVRL